jgi:hypothetical protein
MHRRDHPPVWGSGCANAARQQIDPERASIACRGDAAVQSRDGLASVAGDRAARTVVDSINENDIPPGNGGRSADCRRQDRYIERSIARGGLATGQSATLSQKGPRRGLANNQLSKYFCFESPASSERMQRESGGETQMRGVGRPDHRIDPVPGRHFRVMFDM